MKLYWMFAWEERGHWLLPNGFPAFPDKEAAYSEILRILKPGGIFCGCFYVKGENRRTDWEAAESHVPESGSKDCGGHGGFPVQEGESNGIPCIISRILERAVSIKNYEALKTLTV